MNDTDLARYFSVLEITSDATFIEMKNSYIHLRNLYSKDNLSISPLVKALSKKKQKQIVKDIDDAYQMLEKYYQDKKIENIKSRKEKIQKSRIPTFEVIGGEALKMIRTVLGIDLEEIAFLSGVPLKHLTNIELERYDLLPPDIYVKTFLRKYAVQLSLDAEKVVSDYFKRVEQFKSGPA